MEETDNNRFGGGSGDGCDERFARLFDQMEYEDPPHGLDSKIMSRIIARETRRSSRKQWLQMILLPLAGVAAIIGSLIAVVRLTGFEIRISIPRPDISSGSLNLYILLAVCALLLLIADTLIRKRIDNKRRS